VFTNQVSISTPILEVTDLSSVITSEGHLLKQRLNCSEVLRAIVFAEVGLGMKSFLLLQFEALPFRNRRSRKLQQV